ncbi:BTAD domain-containing putative transcriptional regulator [[Actinomadura] parvosata]|uniref:BTAD domain-containing putative transcriptional regulator n=1 Tax=[Actinomadura] parvosata TaxID=1955412 RepID=UPI00406CD14A
MRFGVLGQVQAWGAGDLPVPVPEFKVRVLLADLLVHHKRLVPADRLIDDLWGDELPANPTSALQLKVSRLRHALEQAEVGAGKLVVSQRPGYLLHGVSDADTFAELTSQALKLQDPRARAAALDEALGLWRGPAFADFAEEDFARLAAQRLEEQRLAALEARAEARLELGEHALLVAELSELVERHPMRERLRALQMRALYRAGRQSEALAGFLALRHRLAEDLGVDPSPELIALHQSILEQDPALSPPPAQVTLSPPKTNLPTPLTGLIGRRQAVNAVRELLREGRLVTLTGVGGVGKTRLALEVAHQATGYHPDGVWLIELAGHFQDRGLPDVNLVAQRLAAVLGVRDDRTAGAVATSSVEVLADALRAKRLLLVLDNCEHIVDPVAKLVERLLWAAPDLRILATSREPLAVPGEAVWPVTPLTPPGPPMDPEPALMADNDAVRLFVERVCAVLPGFALDELNASYIAELCRRLDGLPLALELAAMRVPALGVRELVNRLDDRFRILAAGRRNAPQRQRTLQAVLDWSWDLLTELDRTVLRRLAVHAGGCDITAAEVVCGGTDIGPENVVDVLGRLVDRSLVRMEETPQGPRYSLLETVAHYCRMRLREAGELDDVSRRFQDHYLSLARTAATHLRTSEQRAWLDRLDLENANLWSALDGLVRQGDTAGSLELITALMWYWFLRGRLHHARDWLDRVPAGGGTTHPDLLAAAVVWRTCLGLLIERSRDPVRLRRAEQALRDMRDPRERARVQWILGHALHTGLEDLSAGELHVSRALAAFREVDDRWGRAAALSTAGQQAMARGDLTAIEEYGEHARRLFCELGDDWGRLQTISPLAHRAAALGDRERAARLHHEGLQIAENLRLWSDAVEHTLALGRLAILAGDFSCAREQYERGRRLAVEQRDARGLARYELEMALLERREGRADLVEERLRELLRGCRAAFGVRDWALIHTEFGFAAEQRGDGETALSRHREGLLAARITGDPLAMAPSLTGLAGALTLLERHDDAALLLGAAQAARRSKGPPPLPAEDADTARVSARARSALGESAFAGALRQGGELGMDEVLALCDRDRPARRP